MMAEMAQQVDSTLEMLTLIHLGRMAVAALQGGLAEPDQSVVPDVFLVTLAAEMLHPDNLAVAAVTEELEQQAQPDQQEL